MNSRAPENGFALITVLMVQLMIGIIAYTAMETASLGSQQTIASRQAHTVYNGAEQILLSGIRCIQTGHKSGSTGSDLIGTCAGDGLTLAGEALGAIRLTATDEMATGARRTLSVLAIPPLPDTFYDADGAYTCFGANCVFNPPTSAASPGADGTDRMLPGQASGDNNPLALECGSNGSHRPPENPDGEDKAGLIIPNGSTGDSGSKGKGKKGGGGGKSQFEGNPPIIDNAEDYNDLYGEEGELAWETLERAESELNDRIDALSDKADSLEGETITLSEGETGIWIVKEGQTLTLDGKTAGGTIILEGGTLELKGNECFAGMVVGRNGGQISASGTPAIVGATLQIAGFMQDASLKGNASIYYSSSALEWAQGISNGMSSGEQWSIINFHQVAGH